MFHNKEFHRRNYLALFWKMGLVTSFSVHLLVVGGIYGMNASPVSEKEGELSEYELLEQQSVEINALSAEEVRALIAALEGMTGTGSCLLYTSDAADE